MIEKFLGKNKVESLTKKIFSSQNKQKFIRVQTYYNYGNATIGFLLEPFMGSGMLFLVLNAVGVSIKDNVFYVAVFSVFIFLLRVYSGKQWIRLGFQTEKNNFDLQFQTGLKKLLKSKKNIEKGVKK